MTYQERQIFQKLINSHNQLVQDTAEINKRVNEVSAVDYEVKLRRLGAEDQKTNERIRVVEKQLTKLEREIDDIHSQLFMKGVAPKAAKKRRKVTIICR